MRLGSVTKSDAKKPDSTLDRSFDRSAERCLHETLSAESYNRNKRIQYIVCILRQKVIHDDICLPWTVAVVALRRTDGSEAHKATDLGS